MFGNQLNMEHLRVLEKSNMGSIGERALLSELIRKTEETDKMREQIEELAVDAQQNRRYSTARTLREIATPNRPRSGRE